MALYSLHGGAWALTERASVDVERRPKSFRIGSSALDWRDDHLVVDIDERTAVFGRPVQGRVVFRPRRLFDRTWSLDAQQRHRWWPVAPLGRVEVDLGRVRFSGEGYYDSNFGEEPLESAFEGWSWSRATMRDRSIIVYDAQCIERQSPTDTRGVERALSFGEDGKIQQVVMPRRAALPPGRWGMTSTTRLDEGGDLQLLRLLEDSPFYTRSLLQTTLDGEIGYAMHESLSLSRFVHPIVQRMLPYRMRRDS